MNLIRTIRYVRKPGTTDSLRCEVCGAVCAVDRSIETYANWGAAMTKKQGIYDVFTCPHHDTDWHNLATRLVDAIAETPSRRLAALMHQDLEDVLVAANVEGVSLPAKTGE